LAGEARTDQLGIAEGDSAAGTASEATDGAPAVGSAKVGGVAGCAATPPDGDASSAFLWTRSRSDILCPSLPV
jgi:hypothetical protein